MEKRGSLALVGLIVALVLALAGGTYLALTSDGSLNFLTGALIGIETISGECNISVTESILNIGHDYECLSTTNGFIIDKDNIILDCQGHSITCVGDGCSYSGPTSERNNTFGGIKINNHQGITIQNCYVYNFTNGILIEGNSTRNVILNNYVYNNTNGIRITNGTANNITGNTIDTNYVCGINVSNVGISAADASSYNNIWDNKIFNNSRGDVGGKEACNPQGSYNYWYLAKSCTSANIRGGPCLGGNWWSSYTGIDSSGDGLGDTLLPYLGGGIVQSGVGDSNPLTDVCSGLPAIVSENTTCSGKYLNSTSGEGIAIIKNNVVYRCNGTTLNGNGEAQNILYSDAMRGIEIKNVHDVTVIGCNIHNFTYGVYIENAHNVNLINLTVYNNNNTGIYIGSLAYNVIVENSTITNTEQEVKTQEYGIKLRSAKPGGGNNIIRNNIINYSLVGIYLYDSSDTNSIYSNEIYNNTEGILVNNSDAISIYNNVIRNNTNKGLWVVSSDLSGSDFGTSTAETLNTVYGNTYGYYFESSTLPGSATGLTGNISSNTYGIYLLSLTSGTNHYIGYRGTSRIYDNTYGVVINDSNYVYVDNVNVSGNNNGIYADGSLALNLSSVGNNYIYNNSYGLYLSRTNYSSFEPFGTILYLNNNTNNVVLLNSVHNKFDSLTVYGGSIGINLTSSHNNTIKTSNVSLFTLYNFYLNASNDNVLYDNYIDNSTSGSRDAYDDGTNRWNTSLQSGTNILGNAYLGGNYWNYYAAVLKGNDTTGDGIGDVPANYSISGGSNLDYLPLTTTLIACGEISSSFILHKNITANGNCLVVTANNITLDFAGYYLIGNNSGIGINVSNKRGIFITNAHLQNFNTAIYIDSSNSTNISSSNISHSSVGINLIGANSNRIYNNYLINNSLGINLTNSYNNSVYNNFFNNADNAVDDGSVNNWNLSYQPSTTVTNIISGNTTGGNFWSNYAGRDTGGGEYPHSNMNDGIGDTQYPYTNNGKITGGDYLPLTSDNGSTSGGCLVVSTDTILNADVACASGNGIAIIADGVTFNCNDRIVSGSGTGSGILVDGRKNVIIKNCNITSFYYGIKILNSERVQIIDGNDLRLNGFYGIYLYNSNHTIISANDIINDNNGVYSILSRNTTITSNNINLQKKFYGIYLFDSENNTIYNNTLWDNYHGIYLVNSSDVNVTFNNVTYSDEYSLFLHRNTTSSHFNDNRLSFGDEAIRIKDGSNNNRFSNNTISHHLSYGIHLTSSNSNLFINNSLENNSINIYLNDSSSNTFNNNSIFSGTVGIRAIGNSNSLTLINNSINSTILPSLEINDSSSALLRGNKIYNSAHLNNADSASIIGNNFIYSNFNISNSDSVNVSENTLQYISFRSTTGSTFNSNSLNQLVAYGFASGTISSNTVSFKEVTVFDLQHVDSSIIYNNDIQSSAAAIKMYTHSNDNTIYHNWLKNNTVGLNVSNSSGNVIYNNYFENTNNVFDDTGNKWNTTYSCSSPNIVGGPCQGGNFYSTYHGLDNGASGRQQGDGIGDQPASYTVSSMATDYLPLVLYVARQYFAPTTTLAATMTAWGNTSGELSNEEVVPNAVQIINYSSGGQPYLEIVGLFNQSNVHAETLKINFTANKTGINKSSVSGILLNYTIYLYHNRTFDAGVYVCPDIFDLSQATETCAGRINFTTLSAQGGVILSLGSGNSYKLSNLTNGSAVGVLNNGATACGGNILHDVTLTSDLSCSVSNAALSVLTDNIVIDFAGHSLIGSGSGIGINISSRTGITIKNANIKNFSTAIYVDPSTRINISRCNITNNSIGIQFTNTNNSFIVTTRLINNTLGLNLTTSYNNTIYDNYFNNTNNTREGGYNNTWNVSLTSGTNILGGSYFGGNFWDDYTGWDADADGIGETLIPYNNSYNLTKGDYMPLTEVGAITCGEVSINITMGKNISVSGTCFNFTNKISYLFDCNGYQIIGSGSGTAFNLSGTNFTIVRNCTVKNFSTAISLHSSNNNSVYRNRFENNSFGITLISSTYNLIYNNLFNNTDNAVDARANFWNTTYNCSIGLNILGGNCIGGNFWSNYSGEDNGNPSAAFNRTPWNISSDKIGDTLIPYNNSDKISLSGYGDFLPLVKSTAATGGEESTPPPSGGGNGGGGGGSPTKKAAEEPKVNCTQSWECSEWGECMNGAQTRNCNDINNCENKKEAGQVDKIFTSPKPSESKTCIMPEEPAVEEAAPPAEKPVVEVTLKPSVPMAVTLSSLALVAVCGSVYALWYFGAASNRLRRKLRKLDPLLAEKASESLKDDYLDVYKLYLKLSENKKRNFYARISDIREKIEEQLISEKKIKELLEGAEQGDLADRKMNYLEIYNNYQKLPEKTREKYYAKIVRLRDRLERGE